MLQSIEPTMAEAPAQPQPQPQTQFGEYPQSQNVVTAPPEMAEDSTPQYASKEGAVNEAKKTAFIIIAVLLVGLALLVFGIISYQNEKVVGKDLKGLAGNAYSEVVIYCSPCGDAQSIALKSIMTEQGFINRFHGSSGTDRLLANLSGTEIKSLAGKEWVKKIVSNSNANPPAQ